MNVKNRMEQEPLISVIVPVYNMEEYLERCINSILKQTYSNLEILLIDDGSTDASLQICNMMQEEDSRIRVFHKKNGGSSAARNLGLKEAKGEYFAFVDSDDYIEEDMYWQLMEAILYYNLEIAQVSRDEISEDGSLRPNVCEPPEVNTVYQSEEFFRELLLHKGDCSFCTKLFHRDLFHDLKFPEGALNEDFNLIIQMLQQEKQIVSLPYVGYHVFYKSNSNTRKTDPEAFSRVYEDIIINAKIAETICKETFPRLLTEAKRFSLYQRLEYFMHIPISKMIRKNKFYRQQVAYLRLHGFQILFNPYLTGKNKQYLLLFLFAPKTTRRIHRKIMNSRK